ncbi:MAG: HAD-IIIC family phosphatase [Lachnospiraceae bacterium]|nr:HAD-IIIC family phosphatase [Lachnospiraceae bacterium]
MYRFRELAKASKKDVEGKEYRVAVLGNVATQFLSQAIGGYAHLCGMNLKVFDADYDQIDAQLLDPSSETYGYAPDYILLYLATDRIYEEFMKSDPSLRASFADEMIGKLKRYWDLIEAHCGARILQMGFTSINDAEFGSYGLRTAEAFAYQMKKLDWLLSREAGERKGVYPVDILSVQQEIGTGKFYDPVLYYNAKVNIALDSMGYVAKKVFDVIDSLQGHAKKCVILDLDNTLWGGVIGDDGLSGIEIGELGRGHAYADLQLWLKSLKQRGILLAVCSKNEEDTAKEPFISHEEMVLKLSDIAIFVANWQDKASNIRYIQQTLNIGMDSMVFIDDNPFERELVRSMIPEICVPELPSDPACYLGYLQSLNLFETASYSSEDADRTGMYQAEAKRRESEAAFASLDEYLVSLEMEGEALPFDEMHYPRIAQLTQRSNQFNLRTVRYTEEDIARIASDEGYVTLYYTLKDKFGDHGLVSVVILKKESPDVFFVDTWLMSCRVLKRGMEEFIINHLVSAAGENGAKTLKAEYIPTKKNKMVEHIYEQMGFDSAGDNKYSLNVNDFRELKTYIKG